MKTPSTNPSLPAVGLRHVMPQKWAGIRREPPRSLPHPMMDAPTPGQNEAFNKEAPTWFVYSCNK